MRILFALISIVGLGAQSYPPYPYNLGGTSPYDRGYTNGYTSGVDMYVDPLSQYGRGLRAGDNDYWIDRDREANERARRNWDELIRKELDGR